MKPSDTVSQKRNTMMEAAKFFNLQDANRFSDNELHIQLGLPVAQWVTNQYKDMAKVDKILYSMAYFYAYPLRGKLNPGLREVIHLTADPDTGKPALDSLYLQAHQIAVNWNGRDNDIFMGIYSDIAKHLVESDKCAQMINYLSAWEPVSIMNPK